jgi:hypothetical protein
MQNPWMESPAGVAPQNDSPPLPTKAGKPDFCPSRPDFSVRRKAGQIAAFLQFAHIGRRQLMELAHSAGKLDPRITPIIEDWDRMKPPLRNGVDLDLLCEAHGVDPAHFISVVGEAEMRFRDNASIIIAALSMPKVIEKSVRTALTTGGFKDREMLMKYTGFLPQPKKSQVPTLSYAAIRAEANTNIGEPLPRFEETMELIGDEE